MSEHDSESEVNLDLGKGEPDSDAEGSEESEQDGEIVDGSEEEQKEEQKENEKKATVPHKETNEKIKDDEVNKDSSNQDDEEEETENKQEVANTNNQPKQTPRRPLGASLPMSSTYKKNKTTTLPFMTMDMTNQGEKTIFSRISEDLFNKYLNTDSSRPRTFEELTSEEFLNYQQSKMKKENKDKFKQMMERHEQYENTKKERMKERKDKDKEKLKTQCTWTPNGVKSSQFKNTDEFYSEQKRFLEDKKKEIEKLAKEREKAEKISTKAQLVSKNSKKLAEKKRAGEKEQDFYKRLQSEKLKNIKDKAIKKEVEDPNKPKGKIQKKKTPQEIQELSNKLFSEHETFRKNKEEKLNENIQQISLYRQSIELVSPSTKKVLLDKFISSYEKALLELFNKKDDFEVNQDEYISILKKIGCIHEEENEKEEELAKESFSKYLNMKDEHIKTHQLLLFALSFLGIYKGSDEPQLETEEKIKVPTSSSFIKNYLPELDLNTYQYNMKTVSIIKKKFILFCSNLTQSWAEENSKKRMEKKERLSQSSTSSRNNPLTKSKKENEKIESSRKRMLDQATFDIDSNQQNSLSPNSKDLQDKLSKNQLKLEDIYQLLQKRKEKELANLKAQKEKEEFKECTFQPNATTKPVNPKDVPANIEKLYTDGKITYMKKLRKEDRNPDEKKVLDSQCTFKPEIHPVNESIFSLNPMEKDQYFQKEVSRMEEARVRKNVENMQSKLGVTNIRMFQNTLDNSFNNEILPTMRFDIEHKSNKESFDSFKKKRNNYKTITSSTIDGKKGDLKDEIAPLLKVEVNIDDNNKIVKLEIYPGDDPIKITEDFCAKHGLGEDKKMRLQKIIQEKLNEAQNDNFSASQQS